VIQKKLDIPAGKRPIVLTFDDGRPTQFRYLANGVIDPQSAVGVLASFHHIHPDWPMRGTFYLIAGSDDNGVPFDQEGLEGKKVRQLLKWGFEIGNHTLHHVSFRALGRRQIVREVAGGDSYLKKLVPGIRIQTLALPYGDLPFDRRNWPLLRRSPWSSNGYRNIGVVLLSDGLCPSPYSSTFDPFRIPRIKPKPGYVESTVEKATGSSSDDGSHGRLSRS
jgi:peptidoglycan/xylan/chitin deacetylase (PgdA/CDA1 family)